MSASAPDGTYLTGARVGGNGCGLIISGLFFAAYAADRRPEANRVTAWVGPWWSWNEPRFHPDAPVPQRNKPATAQALLEFNYDDDSCTACVAQADTIDLGCKFKPPTDPALVALVEFHHVVASSNLQYAVCDSDLVRRVAPVLEALLPVTAKSCWHEDLTRISEIFNVAAATRGTVRCG
ncbi:MAG TPA: hypothetical protein VHD87_12730 [Acidimicrobiales bacterium]|nr:hypothetical protein [Acidimicrobiales bacterium]